MINTKLNKLQLSQIIETTKVLKKAISANRALANLNGVARIIPNSAILINSLVLQEAKEVQNYKEVLLRGFTLVKDTKLLLKKHVVEIQGVLEQNDAGVRKQAGTNLKNALTGEVIYTPPQDYETIKELLTNLENYINEPNELDPLVNMAIIHHQFESIHPFYDGNGRTGRIINILYLILKDLLDIPVLYLSRYIITHKANYYRLLQEVRTQDKWEEWILYILDAVEQTSLETIELINNISDLMIKTQDKISKELAKIYSKDLVEILLMHPYTKIEFLIDKLNLHRDTASKYLRELENIGILKPIKIGRSKYFINIELFDMLKKEIRYIFFIC